jgi:rubrerythrin
LSATEVYTEVYNVINELSSKFNVPPPRIVWGNYPTASYSDGTIYLPINIRPDMVERVTAHEFAHHLHEYFGARGNVEDKERFARMFEEVYVNMKERGYEYPVENCRVCGTPMFMYDGAVCPTCGTTYKYVSGAGPVIIAAIGAGLASAVLASMIYGKFPPRGKDEIGQFAGNFLASSFVSLLAGLVIA